MLGGPAALARPARAAVGWNRSRIAIVGGGIAGLTAALRLQDKGIGATVYEASDRIGGRMHSDRSGYFSNGQVAEFCGELIDTAHTTIRGLAKRFHLPLTDLIAAQPNGTDDTYWFLGGYYTQAQADDDFASISDALFADTDAADYPTLYNSYTQAGKQLDHLSVYDWIESRVPGGHSSRFGRLLDSAYAEEYGADTSQQASLNLLYLLGFQPDGLTDFAMFGASDERFHITGGNEQLPEAIAATLSDVRTNWQMTSIATNRDGTVSLRFSTDSGSTTVTADQVILALPFSVLRTLDYSRAGFDNLKKTAITQLGAGRNTKLQLQFRGPLLERQGPVGPLDRQPLHRHRDPEHLGVDARPERRVGDPQRLLRRQHRRCVPPVDAVLERGPEPRGHGLRDRVPLTARDGVPRDHEALERQGVALDPVPRPEPALLLLVLEGRPVHRLLGLRGGAPGERPLRRRALLDGLPGLHGRRRLRGDPRGERGAGRLEVARWLMPCPVASGDGSDQAGRSDRPQARPVGLDKGEPDDPAPCLGHQPDAGRCGINHLLLETC